ncbi:hypothetical protein OIY81_824 [Cryptosporidium canis]|uniref:Uncharacterized protein n=1 Tax=Cryptosporidium canis TaxID=195482 RepID=A0ABQ8P7R4_9CRYT|nr:hypothetical protein OJ252_1539 [Cryptosporidium canis]KAJ1613934.1 hypothetical protein OIY81_824 [Cryptosporidium canis]
MEVFSDNSKYISDLKKLTHEADKIIQQHQLLIELDHSLNINRESLSALRRDYSNNNQKAITLEGLEYSPFETSNKLLKLGDFFLSTSNYIIHKYLLSEKKAIIELVEELRKERVRQVDRFLSLYPNIPESSLAELNFIIKDTKKDKQKVDLVQSGATTNYIKLVPCFRIFDKIDSPIIEFSSVD